MYHEQRDKKAYEFIRWNCIVNAYWNSIGCCRDNFYTNTEQHKDRVCQKLRRKGPCRQHDKILNRINLHKFSDNRDIAASNIVAIALIPCFPKIWQRTMKLWSAWKKVLPQEVTEDGFDQFVKGSFAECERVQSPKVVSKFFKRLISFSKGTSPVTEKKDRAIWVVFLRNAYHIGKAVLFRLPFHSGWTNIYIYIYFLAKLQSFATNAADSDIRRRTAKPGEYFQAALRVVATCLSPDLYCRTGFFNIHLRPLLWEMHGQAYLEAFVTLRSQPPRRCWHRLGTRCKLSITTECPRIQKF